MAETSTVMTLIGAFIGVAIMLGIGVQILGNVQTSTNCNSLPGFNSTGLVTGNGQGAINGTTYSNNPNEKYSGWALSCLNNNTSMQSAYALLIVIMIVIAAVSILFVVRML